MKYRSNQKQFELNAAIDSILENNETETQQSQPSSDGIQSLARDEKRLKKARETASRKRRQKDQAAMSAEKKARFSGGADSQLFRGKTFNNFVLLCEFSYLDPLANPSMFLVCLIIYGN